ncbi:Spy/CpxP family protein refolding chaperone [Pseudoalteromonas fenneropenaei]|uniref:Spy/CpxP family protein refolding chaperone n=1 Tax=Pseudoalteromonas fenneropenaei TaxID=1737459 RepID=A0ABV7CH77_9GAMM
MNAKKLLLGAVVGFGLVVSQVANAKPHNPEGLHFLLNPKVAAKLALTDAQQTELKTIMADHKVVMESLGGNKQANREAIEALVQADSFDETKARALLQGFQPEQLEAHVERLKVRHRVYHVLTAEQRAKLEKWREARKEGKKPRGERHDG